MHRSIRHLIAAGACLVPAAAPALEIDPDVVPEITLGGRLVATGNYDRETRPGGGSGDEKEIDISDSTLLLGLSKYLFGDQTYGFATFGLFVPDDDSDVDDTLFLNHLVVGVGGRAFEARIGRTRLPNTLVQFPTIRDDDLLGYTHALNGGSNARGEEYQVYGGVAQATWYPGGGPWWVTGAATARAETDLADLTRRERTRTSELNGYAVGLAYDVPQAIRFDRGLRFAGLMVDGQEVGRIGGGGRTWVTSLIGGASVNLSEDPEHAWSLHGQAIYTAGERVAGLGSLAERAQAERWSAAAALVYVARPDLQTRWQAALTLAWRDYADFADASSVALVPSVQWRLGSGVALVAQYRYEHSASALARATDAEDAHAVRVGLTFGLSGTFNESVGQRGTILDLEHDMSNPGPSGAGH